MTLIIQYPYIKENGENDNRYVKFYSDESKMLIKLETVNAEKLSGIISQQDIDFALESWVNSIEGKTAEEIEYLNSGILSVLKQEWFIEEESK